MTDEQKNAIDHAQKILRAVKLYELADLLSASIADTAGAMPVAQVSIKEGFIVGGINYRLPEGKHEVFPASPAPSVADAAGASDKPLTEAQIEAGWRQTFSTDNPYCPCNLKSFTKAVRWAEHAKESK